MDLTADRLSGGLFLLFGLALFFAVIPAQTEAVDSGNLAPATLPRILAVVIGACGAALLFKPTAHRTQGRMRMALAGLYAGLLALGIYAMSFVGFVYVAPPLALAIMWLIGERRPLWLVAGVALMPAVIWFLVTQALGRALP